MNFIIIILYFKNMLLKIYKYTYIIYKLKK